MAFSKNPEVSTYQTKMISLLKQENHRGSVATQDEDYLNCYIEIVSNKEVQDSTVNVVKRPGCSQYAASVGSGVVRGMHYNQDFGKLYYCVGRNIYVHNVETGAADTTLTNFFTSSTGTVGFCDYLYDNGTSVVIATDGTELGQITETNVITMNADADMPVHIPQPVFLNGYLFVVKADTADLYNSDLNNPLAWTPGDFISAEIGGDIVKALVKLNNYLLVFGTNTIEYFWDAANPSGSPLQRNDTPIKFTGFLGGVASLGNRVYFVGYNRESQPSVFMMEDFKIEEMGSPSLIRYLSSLTSTYTDFLGSIISHQGHDFYVLKAGTLTYVCNLSNKLWARWAFQSGTSFDMRFAINTKNSTSYQPIFVLNTNATLYKLDQSLYQDVGVNFTVSGVTDNQLFESYNEKSMNRLVVWGDKPSSSSSLSLQWSDDDYQTFSTARTIELYQQRPSLFQLGRFRRRAFKWSFSSNHPLRLQALEVDINIGQA